MKVLIADDHRMVREGLRSLIEREAGMEVIAEADNGREAVALALKLNPDIIVMDIGMPDLNGIEATRQILVQCPNVRVLALSMHADTRYAAGMLMAGAKGYVVKSAAYDELVAAIKAVSQGQAFLSAQVANVVIDDYARRLAQNDAASPDALTEREREIVQLIAEGHTTRSIAEALGVSGKTIDTHRQNIMSKLDLHSVAEITRYAIREGLTQDD